MYASMPDTITSGMRSVHRDGSLTQAVIIPRKISIISPQVLTPSVLLGHIFTMSFECDKMILLTLGRVCGGEKVNGQTLYW